MLARAELSQVKDSPRCAWLKCWAKRLLPPVVALLLVAAGIFASGRLAGDEVPPGPQAPAVADIAAPVTPPVVEEQPQQAAGEAATAPAKAEAGEAEAPAATTAAPEEKAAVPAPAAVPDAQKQRLMQSAGKILRQQ